MVVQYPLQIVVSAVSWCRQSVLLSVQLVVLGLSSWSSVSAAEDLIQLPPGGGQIDVREFGAKGDGKTDDTAALRAAIKDADKDSRCVYLPNGVYLLTDTVGWRCRRTLMGASRDGVVLRLKDGCAGFGDPTKPKPLIHTAMPGNYGGDSQANAAFDNYLLNLTIDTGSRNPGAIALRHTTHNLGVVENVLIRSGDGAGVIGLDLAQTEFGPGMITRTEIIGFDTGILTPGNVSNAVFQHITLKRQKVVGLMNNFPLSVYDLRSENSVPAIRNSAGWMAQLVLVGAKLSGGAKAGTAIDNQGQVNLRNVTVEGYGTALNDRGRAIAGPQIATYFADTIHSLVPAKPRHLGLPIEEPPAVFSEPVDQWVVLSPDGNADMTAALQKAIDSGARTIYLKPGSYHITDTLIARPSLRRLVTLVGGAGGGLGANMDQFGKDKPFVRIEGDASLPPLTIEGVGFGAWPHQPLAMELAGARTVYLKYARCPHPGAYLKSLPAAAGGKLFMDEMPAWLDLAPGLSVWIRQSNPENNPYGAGKALPSYIVNRGSLVWVLGMKTEAPAIHAITLAGGKTEILGGFFRDHVGFDVTSSKPLSFPGLPDLPTKVTEALHRGIPAFITVDAELSASYVQYAWQPGAARDLQAIEMRGDECAELRLGPVNQVIGLYTSGKRTATEVAIESFTVAPALLRAGETCTLTWKVRNAKQVTIAGLGEVPASGQRTVTPTADTTWSLRADGPQGPDEAMAIARLYRTPEAVTNTKPGLSMAIYHGKWSAVPDVAKLTPAAKEVVAGPGLSTVHRASDYALVFTGYVEIPHDGTWTFSTTSDDGSRLWIGADLVVDNDGSHAAQERSGSIALAAGRHPVRIAYLQGGGGAALSVGWSGPDTPSAVVPVSAWSCRP